MPREFQNLEWLNPHIAHRPSSSNLRSKSPAGTVQSSSSPRSDNKDDFVAKVLNKSRIFCEPKTDVFDGFEADNDVAQGIKGERLLTPKFPP